MWINNSIWSSAASSKLILSLKIFLVKDLIVFESQNLDNVDIFAAFLLIY